ncbi:MAG: GDSL family lipase [Comamonadaceae bacterium]|nr:MAG: GDSL family lipase [Comamonadaceae bacterium]
MPFQRLRRAFLVAACASSALLAACGGGDVESQLSPSRIVLFGDAFSDLGQRGSRYTINDGSVNVWAAQVAAGYGKPLATAASGGLAYATGSARIASQPDAAGNASTPTVTQQVDTFLAANTIGSEDLVIVSGGVGDVVAEVAKVLAGTQTEDQAFANLRQAGRDLGAQARRLVQAGGKHVVVVGTYNLGKSPWAISTNRENLLEVASSRFNEEMLVSIVDLGSNVLYVDAAFYLNLVTNSPSAYKFEDSTTVVCTSVDPGPGIGIGAGQVNSALCNSSTIAAGLDPERFIFADRVYLTPTAARLLGDYAYDRIRQRW